MQSVCFNSDFYSTLVLKISSLTHVQSSVAAFMLPRGRSCCRLGRLTLASGFVNLCMSSLRNLITSYRFCLMWDWQVSCSNFTTVEVCCGTFKSFCNSICCTSNDQASLGCRLCFSEIVRNSQADIYLVGDATNCRYNSFAALLI